MNEPNKPPTAAPLHGIVMRLRERASWLESRSFAELHGTVERDAADAITELLAMLKRFAERGEPLWDDQNFRDGYKKISSGDLVDCRKILRKFGITDFDA